ncbi:MAG: hypothetical protein M3340_05070 [Actinomycetota bacterium]|nr:hypothetical protein [Actinomycetota bacterium]
MRALVAIAVLALACALPAAASAHDSLAPRGAEHRWLPSERWVQKHWMPFDESRLYELLGVDTRAVFQWLSNDHRTLAQLARRRGVSPRPLAKRLMEPRRESLSRREYRLLRSRTERVLTQGHLAQHVFFHVFHGSHLTGHENGHIAHLFGVDRHEYNRLRQRAGLSPYQIAKRHGRPRDGVRRHVVEMLRAEAALGVRAGAMSSGQADLILARQLRVVDCWLGRPAPKFDPHHPFGDRYSGHGPHSRKSRGGLVRRKPPRGCWLGLLEG